MPILSESNKKIVENPKKICNNSCQRSKRKGDCQKQTKEETRFLKNVILNKNDKLTLAKTIQESHIDITLATFAVSKNKNCWKTTDDENGTKRFHSDFDPKQKNFEMQIKNGNER